VHYLITLADGSKRTVQAESYEEKPAGYITFWSSEIGQVLTLRKVTITEIEAQDAEVAR
jgi:hypothetical protein